MRLRGARLTCDAGRLVTCGAGRTLVTCGRGVRPGDLGARRASPVKEAYL